MTATREHGRRLCLSIRRALHRRFPGLFRSPDPPPLLAWHFPPPGSRDWNVPTEPGELRRTDLRGSWTYRHDR